MRHFENVKFHMIKNNLIERILEVIYKEVEIYSNIFLTDRLHFNSLVDLRTDITFFFEGQEELNTTKEIIYKPLTIEDFLYRGIEEIVFECKIYLKRRLNEMEENLKLGFLKLTILYTSGTNILSKYAYYNYMGENIKNVLSSL